jgi:hypothetical protein
MTINIELKPDEERALLERARLSGRNPVQYVQKLIRDDIQLLPRLSGEDDASAERAATLDAMTDHEFVAECARVIGGNNVPTLEDVRQMLSKIPASLAQEIIAEREDRF